MAKRELSRLQKAYKEFFLAMLNEYAVESPARLSKQQKTEFFTRIKDGWKARKKDFVKVEPPKASCS